MLFCHNASHLCFFSFQHWMSWECFIFFFPQCLQCFVPLFIFFKGILQARRITNMKKNLYSSLLVSLGLPCRASWITKRPQIALDGPVYKSSCLFNAFWLLGLLGQFWGAHAAPAMQSLQAVQQHSTNSPAVGWWLVGPSSPHFPSLCKTELLFWAAFMAEMVLNNSWSGNLSSYCLILKENKTKMKRPFPLLFVILLITVLQHFPRPIMYCLGRLAECKPYCSVLYSGGSWKKSSWIKTL